MLSLTIALVVRLFQYLLKYLNLYQNLMLKIQDHPLKAYSLFKTIILQDLEEKY